MFRSLKLLLCDALVAVAVLVALFRVKRSTLLVLGSCQNKARYRAENVQSDTFLKCILRDEDKTAKVGLLLNFIFL